jgi:hypothetical protein
MTVGRQLGDIQGSRLKADDGGRARRIRMRPELDAIEATESRNQRLTERARPRFDHRASNLGLEVHLCELPV